MSSITSKTKSEWPNNKSIDERLVDEVGIIDRNAAKEVVRLLRADGILSIGIRVSEYGEQSGKQKLENLLKDVEFGDKFASCLYDFVQMVKNARARTCKCFAAEFQLNFIRVFLTNGLV